MLLSICMIARDEEKNLARALLSVAHAADEIIVTDTGSADRTVEIARDLGAKVFHFPWCDDFSAARNASIENASGDWIFWLDADEELLQESVPELRRLLEDRNALACYISRQDLVDTGRPDLFTEMWQLRLFRNRPDLRFQGRCHPQFHPPVESIAEDEDLEIVHTSAVTIRHYGYTGELKQEKLERAARLLEMELADRPGQLYYLIEYGRTLLQLRDRKGHHILALATEKVLEQRENKSPPMPLAAALLEYLLQLPKKELPCGLVPEQVKGLALKWFPKGPPLLWIMAMQAFSREDYEEAEAYLESLVEMGRDVSYDRHISFDPRIIGGDALLNLGVCRVRLARLADAEECFQDLIRRGLQVKAAKANLKAISRLRAKHHARRKKQGKSKRRKKK